MAENYRVIRVAEDIYIRIKAFQLELIKQGYGKTPSISETLRILIDKDYGIKGEKLSGRQHL